MTLTASGDLLVGKTSTSVTSVGIEARSTGLLAVNRDNATPVYFGRQTSYGHLIEFRKETSIVGKLGIEASGFYLDGEASHSGLKFTSAGITPRLNGSGSDNTVNLGESGVRFKDAHFSGTVNTEAVSTNSLDLQAIAESNTDTAVDVFVYDTSKDSDGGAWRHRTQNTSWYNETLSTSTRGATKKFPAVAVLVTESNKVTIYDGDDPDMPMWMVFDGGARQNMIYGLSDNSQKATKMLNGLLVSVGNDSGGQGGTFPISFITDNGYFLSDASNSPYKYKGNIEQRNDTLSITAGESGNYGVTVSRFVNDVAMTVLPNAPIDADTGLPVPTIAVATNGGISIIKDTGTVVDIISNSGSAYNPTSFVDIDDNYNLIFEQDSGGRSLMFIPIPSADRTTVANDGDRTDKRMLPTSSTGTGLNLIPRFNGSNASIAVSGKGDDQYIYGGEGVTSYAFGGTKLQSSVAYITSDYNTGHMVGDIKLATLSDTDTTNVTGAELVPNGDFASGTTSWSAFNGQTTISESSGQLTIASSGSDYGVATCALSSGLVEGKKYTFSFNLISMGGTTVYYTRIGTATSGSGNAPTTDLVNTGGITATGRHSVTFTATATQALATHLVVGSRNDGTSQVFDNISVRLAESDRSVNGNGLQVFGTVTKTAVATGADLVAYNTSPANTTLKLPNASGLAFGTGDFTIMMWIKEGTFNTNHYVMDKVLIDGSGAGRLYVIINSSGKHLFGIPGQTAITSTGAAVATGVWQLVSFIRRSGILYFGINGDIVFSASAPGDTEGGSTGHHAYIGDYSGGQANYGFDSMALFRASKTGVSDDQLRKIYNDEKHLFATNAKATLYGTSDAVTALAYDDDTELLHVGTSAGRSEFQGLNRVNNTTDAVGTAISASNGFIVEE